MFIKILTIKRFKALKALLEKEAKNAEIKDCIAIVEDRIRFYETMTYPLAKERFAITELFLIKRLMEKLMKSKEAK